ncbi:hypothetical protein V1477_017411 [Vespula maculifrons]|uniref:Uncharacterized protein n=1 Tax=Vespula maculifrons TaxID=7453 RepID=A0ABD2B5Y5_VESMC
MLSLETGGGSVPARVCFGSLCGLGFVKLAANFGGNFEYDHLLAITCPSTSSVLSKRNVIEKRRDVANGGVVVVVVE